MEALLQIRLTDDLRSRPAWRWSAIAFALAVAASVALCVVKVWTSEHATATDGHEHVTRTSETMVQAMPGVAPMVLLLPVGLTALAWASVGRRVERAGRLAAMVGLILVLPFGYFVIGGFYLPSLIALGAAAWSARHTGPEPHANF